MYVSKYFCFRSLNDNCGLIQSWSILPTGACFTSMLITSGPNVINIVVLKYEILGSKQAVVK